jgi:hypothetical protein
MPSTYTTNTGIEKPGTGEQSGTWGITTNTNFDIIDRAANGVGSISLTGTTHTLTTLDGTLSDGMFKVLVFGGTPSGTNTVTIAPSDAQKLYFVRNNSGESVVLTQGSGSSVTVVDGQAAVVYADGGGASAAVVSLNALFPALQASNNLSDVASASTSRTNLGVAIGSDVQAFDAGLQSISGLTTAADKMIFTTGSDTYAVTDLTSFARTLLDDADAATFVSTLGITASIAELNFNDITTLGTSQASKVVTADASGDVSLSEELKAKSYNETVDALSGTTPTVNCENGNVFTLTTSGATTFTFSNPPSSGTAYAFVLKVIGGGAHALTWPIEVRWPGGTAPDFPLSGETYIYGFLTHDAGTNWYGFVGGEDFQ